MTDKAWKVLGFCLACGIAAGLGTADVHAAGKNASVTTGSPVAGMDVYMERYRKLTADLTQEKMSYGTFTSIFKNLGVAMVEDSLNIRKEPKSDGQIIGKMKSHAGCSVLAEENGWYKIKSGQVTGYVYGKYLTTGQAAKAVAYYDMRLMLRVNTEILRVREGPGTDQRVLGKICEGETYDFLAWKDGWVKFRYKDGIGYAYAPGNAIVAYTIPEAQRDDDLRTQVVNYAVKFVGKPYQWGGTNPNTGVDCSGFVQYVMEHAAGVRLDRTSRQQAEEGEAVPVSNMEPGDLLFYSNGTEINHVALYIGEGKIVHAANRKSGIKISSWNYRNPVEVRRVIP